MGHKPALKRAEPCILLSSDQIAPLVVQVVNGPPIALDDQGLISRNILFGRVLTCWCTRDQGQVFILKMAEATSVALAHHSAETQATRISAILSLQVRSAAVSSTRMSLCWSSPVENAVL